MPENEVKSTTPEKRKPGRPRKPQKSRAIMPKADWSPVFLAALRKSGNIRYSCELAAIDRGAAYKRRNVDAAFAVAWQEALDDAIDGLEAVAMARARTSSDLLLIFLLKAHRPAMYRESRMQIADTIQGTVKIYAGFDPDQV